VQKLLLWIGRLGGIIGVILCAVAILARLRSVYNVAGFQVGTFLLAGVAAMVVGCLGYLAAIAERPRG
jgi:cell division protein FtsX